MAIGDTVQAGLMRIDTSAYERAGQANAKANQAFGLALGEVAKGYFVGQEKKARANEIKEELMRQGVPEDAAANISKNPFLQKEHARKQEAENRMNIARLAQRSAGDALAQKAAFEETRVGERQASLEKAEEKEEIMSEANQFMRTRPQTETPEFSNLLEEFSPDQIPGTPEFEAKELSEPMGARPPLMASFATDKPNFEMFNVGKAPIEQQLPESFQGQAGRIIDMADNKEISPQAADLALNRIQQQAIAEQKAGPTRSEDLAERKFQRQIVNEDKENQPLPPADPVYQQSALDAIDDAISYVEKDSFFNPTAGFLSDTAKGIGGTDAVNLDAALSTITSSVGFDRLQAMRDASPTGGALGQVSENELRQLNASLGSISQRQDDKQLLKNLEKIKAQYSSAVKAIEAQQRAYKMGKSFKTKEEALEFMESQSPETGGIKTSTQGKYKVGDLSVGNYQPGQ